MKTFWLALALFSLTIMAAAQPVPLAAPQLVVHRPGVEDQMRLFWSPVSGATEYDLFTCNARGEDITVLGSTADTTYLDSGLVASRHYRVQARSADTTSGLSNVAGYVRLIGFQGNTAFGLPFRFWLVPSSERPLYGTESSKPSSIIGNQVECGTVGNADRITVQGATGGYAYRNTAASCGWAGSLETGSGMIPSKAYYWNRGVVWEPRYLIVAGDADTTAVGIPSCVIPAPIISGGSASLQYSWRDPRVLPRDRLNLLQNEFTGGAVSVSDRVVEQGGAGRFFYYRTGANPAEWSGSLDEVAPGKAYFIVNKHFGHPWTYRYAASGQP
jgi:hypothetical protein